MRSPQSSPSGPGCPGSPSCPGGETALYPRLLGPAWLKLHPAVRRAHLDGSPVEGAGRFEVGGGETWPARLLGRLLGLPRATGGVDTRLSICARGDAERWVRGFGPHRVVTWQRACPGGLLAERLGALELRFRLEVEAGGLRYRQAGACLRLGPLGCPLPRWLAPQVSAWERAAEGPAGGTRIDVRVALPGLGSLLSYTGQIGCEAAS